MKTPFSRRVPAALALGALAALAALAACKGRGASAKTEIRFGATLPLTGSEARIGGFYREGYDLAIEQANKDGGLQVGDKKLPVRLTLLDDTSTQATAVSLADRLVNSDKVDFLLGDCVHGPEWRGESRTRHACGGSPHRGRVERRAPHGGAKTIP
jgi:branched-chain amino acid transport system substrate-binding protein